MDPAATGVLIVGVGLGTKSLQQFLECTKSYEAAVCFGLATDSYDAEGKVMKRAPYEHITQDKVEEALNKFRGPIKQRPPLFSALRVQGKRLYEYARAGEKVPIEIVERSLTVDELSLTEFIEGGKHEYVWPTQEAERKDKALLEETEDLDGETGRDVKEAGSQDAKRKRNEETEASEDVGGTVIDIHSKKSKTDEGATMSGAIPDSDAIQDQNTETQATTEIHAATETGATEDTTEAVPAEPSEPCPAPAAQLHMTVSSGFYVRSLCHDLGLAVGSLAYMAALVRSRQANFVLSQNVLEYDDLEKGEEVWGPKVTAMLAEWAEKGQSVDEKNVSKTKPAKKVAPPERRRNTSSPEE